MFKDTQDELKRLEAALLGQNEPEDLAATRIIDPISETEIPQTLLDSDIFTQEELDLLLEDPQIIGDTDHYANHANDYASPVQADVYSGDRVDAEELSQELLEDDKDGSITGLAICAALLTVGILCVAVWWIARYWGAF